MGGLDAAALAKITAATVNLVGMTENKKSNKKIENLAIDQQANIRKKKNLLDQQLSNRRAAVGAMGITGSKSSAAVQERIARDAYDEMEQDDKIYQRKYQDLKDEDESKFGQSLFNTMLSSSGKIIK